MAKSTDSIKDELSKYAAKLKQDLDSKKPKVYAPVVWAYQDSRVRDAIAARIAAGEVLTASVQIFPDRALRRERVYFDFAAQGRLDAKNPGILVQISDDNSVAEILDPFDLQNDTGLTVANSTDTLSLFAAQAMGQLQADETAAREFGERWKRFAEQPMLARSYALPLSGLFGSSFGGVFGWTITGGTPTKSSVMSSAGSKEDPDEDREGGQIDDPYISIW